MLNSVNTLSHVILPTEKLCPFHKKSRIPDRDYTPSKKVYSVKLRSLLSSKLCLQIGRGPILSAMTEVCTGCRENKRGASQTLSGVQVESQTLLLSASIPGSPTPSPFRWGSVALPARTKEAALGCLSSLLRGVGLRPRKRLHPHHRHSRPLTGLHRTLNLCATLEPRRCRLHRQRHGPFGSRDTEPPGDPGCGAGRGGGGGGA